jgi:spermidine synthase
MPRRSVRNATPPPDTRHGTSGMSQAWFFGFFLVSGFCSLVYETVWLRLAMAKFGVTTPFVSIVLSVFMAGLALGSWGGGALMRRLRGSTGAVPLRLYGLVELLIGLSGILVPRLIDHGYELVKGAGQGATWGSSAYYLASGAWITVALLPWCTCMGATFPLAMAAIRRGSAEGTRTSFSFLYLSNVFGAILGTIIPTIVLVEVMGFQRTLLVASLLNALLAATVFVLSLRRFPPGDGVGTDDAVPGDETPADTRLYGLPAGSVYWLLFLTGLCSMAMEVVWIRQYTIFLGNVVYSFAAILALYLGATFVGSQVYRLWMRTHGVWQSRLAWILLGFLALLPLLFSDPTLPMRRGGWQSLIRTAAGVIPFSGVLGFLTPMLVDHLSRGRPDRAGRAYAMNVLGSIAGPLVAGFWILPWLGDHWGLVALALPLLGIGVAMASTPGGAALRERLACAAALAASLLLSLLTQGYEATLGPRLELRDHTATVIAAGQGMQRNLLVNGVGMTSLSPVTKYMAHLPLAFLDRAPRNGLVICFGMGTTLRSMLSWGIDSTAVDLVPSVPRMFGYFHPDGPELLRSPLAHVIIDDGRRFLDRFGATYDVITLDPPPPVSAPTSSLLYSREFYEIIKPRLSPGGILQVWIFTDDQPEDAVVPSAAAKALRASFPYIRVFDSVGQGLHCLASMSPLPDRDAAALAARLPQAAATDFVEWGPAPTAAGMFGKVLERELGVDSVIARHPRVPPILDDQPINEYFFLRYLFGYYR